jgi:hypothetical protein
VVVLRDGEWTWWCSCGYQSPVAPTFALVATGHSCGSGGSLATRGRRAAAPLQGGDARGAEHMRTEEGAGVHLSDAHAAIAERTDVRITPAPTADNRSQGGRQPGRTIPAAPSVPYDGDAYNTTVVRALARPRGNVKTSFGLLDYQT